VILIKKGKAPKVLVKDGQNFQTCAVAYHDNPEYYDEDFKSHFDKFASYNDDGGINGFESKLFSLYSYYSDPSVKKQLIEDHHGKCVFCESFILDTDVGDVEHYRPKAGITALVNEFALDPVLVDHPGYFWLSQTWENLFLACKQCNQAYKRTLFDVLSSGTGLLEKARGDFPRLAPGEAPDPTKEIAALLYPGYSEESNGEVDPRDVIKFDPKTAEAKPINSGRGNEITNGVRAKRTIDLVGLNRVHLVLARAAHLVALRAQFILAARDGYVEAVKEEYSIFDFEYGKDCAGKDAQRALETAISPWGEFSALSHDAIEAWNRELRIEITESTINITNRKEVVVRTNTNWDIRLDEQLELLEKCRKTSSSTILAEADTHDLDVSYNDYLARYKVIVGKVIKDKKKIDIARKNIRRFKSEGKPTMEKIERIEIEIADCENILVRLGKADAESRDWLTIVEVSERISKLESSKHDEEMNKLHQTYRGWIVKLNLVADAEARKKLRGEPEASLRENEEKRKELEEKRKELEKQKAPFDEKNDSINGKIAREEKVYAKYYDELLGLHEEVIDLDPGYRNCGAKKDRIERTKALESSIGNLMNWVNGDKEKPNENVKNHLEKKKWPARITKV
jgi:hypothetical protein